MVKSLYHNERTGRGVPYTFDIQFFGGGGGSTQTVRKRDPEPEGLTNLRDKLLDAVLPGVEAYDPSSWQKAQQISQQAQEQQQRLLGMYGRAVDKNSGLLDEMMGVVRSGNVPSALTDAANASVNKGLQSGMGSMLNNLAGRGVVNSSITSKGINGLAQNAADAMNTNYLNAFNAVLNGYAQGLQGGQQNANLLLGGVNAVGNIPTQAYEGVNAQLMPGFNVWNAWQKSYDNREDYDTIVKQGK